MCKKIGSGNEIGLAEAWPVMARARYIFSGMRVGVRGLSLSVVSHLNIKLAMGKNQPLSHSNAIKIVLSTSKTRLNII